ncbi:hypothetical protein B0H10DRAFT_1961948 [Mycena sp. CBHHK59/15]|nr:hypothetical protein B0H10DRAFT_1961948 [Mycena sp. CBHHK59/15]
MVQFQSQFGVKRLRLDYSIERLIFLAVKRRLPRSGGGGSLSPVSPADSKSTSSYYRKILGTHSVDSTTEIQDPAPSLPETNEFTGATVLEFQPQVYKLLHLGIMLFSEYSVVNRVHSTPSSALSPLTISPTPPSHPHIQDPPKWGLFTAPAKTHPEPATRLINS